MTITVAPMLNSRQNGDVDGKGLWLLVRCLLGPGCVTLLFSKFQNCIAVRFPHVQVFTHPIPSRFNPY